MQRSFILGSEWLYYKLYSGPKTSDDVLVDAIKPLSETLLEEGIIKSWFFVRFADPHFHLRIRFNLTKSLQIEKTIRLIYKYLNPFIETNLIWKIANDTYNREIERYGNSLVEKIEQFFFYESEMIVGILSFLEGNEGERIRWLIGLRIINDTLDLFDFNPEQKMMYFESLRDRYGEEFNINKDLKLQLSNKFRVERNAINEILNCRNNSTSEIEPILNLLQIRNSNILSFVSEILTLNKYDKLEVQLDSLISSLLHMQVNRLFKSKQRLQEFVLYDFLYRHNVSVNAKNKLLNKSH